VQRALNALEHSAGPEDGLPGPQTREALKAWQQARDGRPSGYLTAAQLASLQDDAVVRLAAVPTTARRSLALPAPVHDCDRLAGHPADRERVGPGVAWEDLDPPPALRACETAVEEHPDELRFQHQYGRAQLKAGHLDDARLWFRTAADKGYVAAQKHVGHLYAMSLGVSGDDLKAAGWYRRAAEQDDPGAQYLLGLMHVLGRGVTRDSMQAITWFRRAAGQGDAGAQFLLGWMYKQGRGVQPIGPRVRPQG
jgi:TPR repeat protein